MSQAQKWHLGYGLWLLITMLIPVFATLLLTINWSLLEHNTPVQMAISLALLIFCGLIGTSFCVLTRISPFMAWVLSLLSQLAARATTKPDPMQAVQPADIYVITILRSMK